MSFNNNSSEHWNEELEIVYTCGLCETICKANEIRNHPCMESFKRYCLDKHTHYFYPQCEDGNILRKSLVDGTEQNVLEMPEAAEEAEISNEEDFDIENMPENEKKRRIFIEERLIEAVQRRPPLWNFKLPVAERGIRNKEKLWMDVVAVMKGVLTCVEAKKRWKSLVDIFRRHRKDMELPSGSAAKKRSKWVHFDRMNFLQDVNLQNDTTSNISVDQDNSADADTCEMDDSTNSERASRIASSNESRKRKDDCNYFMDEIREIIQEPVNIDIQQNTNQSQSAGFCSTIAYKLDALSEDARDRAMIRIFEVLREERHRDQA